VHFSFSSVFSAAVGFAFVFLPALDLGGGFGAESVVVSSAALLLSGKDRVTSFHAYPDGRVRFSDKALGEIKVQGSSTPAGGSGSGTSNK